MISAVHCLVYADDAEAVRAFFRDVLRWPHVDSGDGWLIFRSGPSEVAAHPTAAQSAASSWSTGPHHEITLVCDDLEGTVAELGGRGAEFTRGIRDDGFGWTISMKVPGAGEMMLYQPKHPLAYTL